MFQIIGIIFLFAMVFGGYTIAGGKMYVILKSLPYEMMMIGGAAIAALLIANSTSTLKGVGGGLAKVFAGPKWKKKDYRDLLSLLFQLAKTMKSKGVIALESHIEKPAESPIFQKYPKILKDHFATDFICDTLRMMTMNLEDPHQIEDVMEKQLEKHHHEALAPANALQTTADALPALGIVAAVLGVIKTMGSITEPPEILGGMIGGGAGGHLSGRVPRLRSGRPAGRAAERPDRGRCGLLQDHPVGSGGAPARQCGPDFRRDRARRRALQRPALICRAGGSAERGDGRRLTPSDSPLTGARSRPVFTYLVSVQRSTPAKALRVTGSTVHGFVRIPLEVRSQTRYHGAAGIHDPV